MAGVTAVQAPTIETKANDSVKEGDDDANQAQRHTDARGASSSRSGSPPSSNCRVLSRRPDGTSEEPGPSELRLLEQALRRESVVDVVEIGPLTVPSTPVRDGGLDGIGNDVRSNLELASVKLSKLAPTD